MRKATMGMQLESIIKTGANNLKLGGTATYYKIKKLEKHLKATGKRDRKNTGSGVAKAKRAKRKAKNK